MLFRILRIIWNWFKNASFRAILWIVNLYASVCAGGIFQNNQINNIICDRQTTSLHAQNLLFVDASTVLGGSVALSRISIDRACLRVGLLVGQLDLNIDRMVCDVAVGESEVASVSERDKFVQNQGQVSQSGKQEWLIYKKIKSILTNFANNGRVRIRDVEFSWNGYVVVLENCEYTKMGNTLMIEQASVFRLGDDDQMKSVLFVVESVCCEFSSSSKTIKIASIITFAPIDQIIQCLVSTIWQSRSSSKPTGSGSAVSATISEVNLLILQDHDLSVLLENVCLSRSGSVWKLSGDGDCYCHERKEAISRLSECFHDELSDACAGDADEMPCERHEHLFSSSFDLIISHQSDILEQTTQDSHLAIDLRHIDLRDFTAFVQQYAQQIYLRMKPFFAKGVQESGQCVHLSYEFQSEGLAQVQESGQAEIHQPFFCQLYTDLELKDLTIQSKTSISVEPNLVKLIDSRIQLPGLRASASEICWQVESKYLTVDKLTLEFLQQLAECNINKILFGHQDRILVCERIDGQVVLDSFLELLLTVHMNRSDLVNVTLDLLLDTPKWNRPREPVCNDESIVVQFKLVSPVQQIDILKPLSNELSLRLCHGSNYMEINNVNLSINNTGNSTLIDEVLVTIHETIAPVISKIQSFINLLELSQTDDTFQVPFNLFLACNRFKSYHFYQQIHFSSLFVKGPIYLCLECPKKSAVRPTKSSRPYPVAAGPAASDRSESSTQYEFGTQQQTAKGFSQGHERRGATNRPRECNHESQETNSITIRLSDIHYVDKIVVSSSPNTLLSFKEFGLIITEKTCHITLNSCEPIKWKLSQTLINNQIHFITDFSREIFSANVAGSMTQTTSPPRMKKIIKRIYSINPILFEISYAFAIDLIEIKRFHLQLRGLVKKCDTLDEFVYKCLSFWQEQNPVTMKTKYKLVKHLNKKLFYEPILKKREIIQEILINLFGGT